MPIKYAEITIVRQESWLTYFKNLIGEENITNNDTIIILFDDGTVTDTTTKDAIERFEMGPKSVYSTYPMYFNKINKNTLFLKIPRVEKNVLKLDFKPIFKDYPNYSTLKKEPSIYNAIYESNDIDIFALIKRASNRYLLAYEDSYFDKSDIVNLFFNLFKG